MSKISPKVNIRHGTFEWKLLRVLKEIGSLTLDSILPAQYSYARLWREVFGLDKKKQISNERAEKLSHIVSATLSRLKEKGLVAKQGRTRNVSWKITEKGEAYSSEDYLPPEDGRLRVVIFDIPESKKGAREWLRGELIVAGYSLLQKSVWLGKRPMSELFFKGISDHHLFEHVHVFEVKERGTLMNVVT